MNFMNSCRAIRWILPVTAMIWLAACSETPPDDALAMVEYLPMAIVVPKGEELKQAEQYAAAHPGHYAFLAVMSRPIMPYGGRAGLVCKDVPWPELKRGMTVVYLAQRGEMVGGMGAGLLVEKTEEGWLFKSWGFDEFKPTLLKPVAYRGVVVLAFVGEDASPDRRMLMSKTGNLVPPSPARREPPPEIAGMSAW
jgi:hypothetical protein